jgi:hypothetical protein
MKLRVSVLLLIALVFAGSGGVAQATIFLDAWGFEDDVDIIVAPNWQFMVICEEREDGSEARVRILELDPFTGEPVGFVWEDEGALGFENGVDPIIIGLEAMGSYLVLIPTEREDGSQAKIILLMTDGSGAEIARQDIDLGDLGFRDDVDCIWSGYAGAIAFWPLESEDGSVRGVVAIDVDAVDFDWGSCRLLSTDGRVEPCAAFDTTEWLPGLADGIDPMSYSFHDRLRLALPVSCPDSTDMLMLDFDNDVVGGNIPPIFISPHTSVKQRNAAGPRPLAFPGYEIDVDPILFQPEECGCEERSILIPVEGTGGADLYAVDDSGTALWVFSIDGTSYGLTVPGYEIGVDVLPLCDLPALDPADRLAVPVESATGAEAGLWILDAVTGELLARVEDPTINPGLPFPGYEIGVDLVRWTTPLIAVPLEGAGSAPGLLTVYADGALADSEFTPELLGFQRSVDPIVAPTAPFPSLIVPIGKDDGSDADVIVFNSPPNLSTGYSLELVNEGLELSRFEWDVDLGLVDKTELGELYLCVPEEAPGGGEARLRFELMAGPPGDSVLAFATDKVTTFPASLYLVDIPSGNIIIEHNNLLGLETGLDLVNGHGPITPGDMPFFLQPTGLDWDGDPTLVWITGSTSVFPDEHAGIGPVSPIRLSHPNPFAAQQRIRYLLPERGEVHLYIVDVTGRMVCRLFRGQKEAGEHDVIWNARNDAGVRVASGVYFVKIRGTGRMAVSKLILLD